MKNNKSKNKNPSPFLNLPHAGDAEKTVIGSIMTFPSSVHLHMNKLLPEYFYFPQHQVIVKAIRELVSKNIPPEAGLVYEELRSTGNLSEAGELANLRSLLDFNVMPVNIGYFLDNIKKYWEIRCVIETCLNIAQKGKQVEHANIHEFLAEAEMAFIKLSESRQNQGLVPINLIANEVLQDLEDLMKNPGKVSGIPSGFIDLDAVISGFQNSDLIILAARPAMGKTALALNFIYNAFFRSERVIAFFSLEMGRKQIVQRLIATNARVFASKFRNGNIEPADLVKIYPEVANFDDRILIDDTASINILDLMSRCRQLKRERGRLDMIVVDYLQLITVGGLSSNKDLREREIAIISSRLKGLAKDLNCPVIALAQLNRGLENRPDKRPKPSDLRESGSIEQDADQIIFLYRDEVYNKESPDKGLAELIIGKNRHGPTQTVKVCYNSEFMAFVNLAKFEK